MKSPAERIASYLDDLLRNRRPRRFRAPPDELDAMQSAAGLRSVQPATDMPDPHFIERLGERLRSNMEVTSVKRETPGVSRRAVLRTVGLAAAAGIAGALVDRAVVTSSSSSAELLPNGGTWRPVATLGDVPAGQAVRFSTGSVEGFVVNDGGTIRALSGVCTHQGCILRFVAQTRRFTCPCHNSAFSMQGTLVAHELPIPPPSLPAIQARVTDGQVEVLVV